MSVQFSRVYGRKPRTKTPAQLIAELEVLYQLNWRGDVLATKN
jgi:hypothetical protein